MVCPLTWPRYCDAEPRTGCRRILEHIGLQSDASGGAGAPDFAYGRTKVFIQSPRSLFRLDAARDVALEKLVIRMQARWRGFVQQRTYGEMKEAAALIKSTYRAHLGRAVFHRKREGARLVLAVLRTHRERLEAHRLRQALPHHAAPLLLRAAAAYGRRHWLRALADELAEPDVGARSRSRPEGPSRAPPVHAEGEDVALQLHYEWSCAHFREQCTAERQGVLRAKYITSQLFKGRKAGYPQSVEEPFVGDRLGISVAGSDEADRWAKLSAPLMCGSILASATVEKVHRKTGKAAPRALIVAEKGLVLCESSTLKVKYSVPYAVLERISCSSQVDSTFVLHVEADSSDRAAKKGDCEFAQPRARPDSGGCR